MDVVASFRGLDYSQYNHTKIGEYKPADIIVILEMYWVGWSLCNNAAFY